MVSARQTTEQNSATHAAAQDFCRIFEQNMDRLYLLSYLLTADRAMAEQCFVGGLEDSANSPRVFKEWAHSWACRMVVQNAIQMVGPRPAGNSDTRLDHAVKVPAALLAVLELPAFERFVFVMSVLERYSDQDCALLLDCTHSKVMAARVRALQQIGSAAEGQRASAAANTGSGKQVPQDVAALAVKREPASHAVALA